MQTENLSDANKKRKKTTEELTRQEKTLLRLQKEQTESTEELAVEIEELKNDISIIAKYPISHVSAYHLTIEDKTYFGKLLRI